jgi:hypothetical protein
MDPLWRLQLSLPTTQPDPQLSCFWSEKCSLNHGGTSFGECSDLTAMQHISDKQWLADVQNNLQIYNSPVGSEVGLAPIVVYLFAGPKFVRVHLGFRAFSSLLMPHKRRRQRLSF